MLPAAKAWPSMCARQCDKPVTLVKCLLAQPNTKGPLVCTRNTALKAFALSFP